MLDRLTTAQKAYLETGINNKDGRLSLFDAFGNHFPPRTVEACLKKGFTEKWFANPMKPDWTVFRITNEGRNAVENVIN